VIPAHNRTRLGWEVRCSAYENHGRNALRLQCRHVQKHVAAAADSDSLAGGDFQMVEEREQVAGGIAMAERLGQGARAAVATQVRYDEFELSAPFLDGGGPILTGTGESMQ